MPEGTQQRDAERRRQLDHHQHGQGGVPVLRGHGARQESSHASADGAIVACEYFFASIFVISHLSAGDCENFL